MFEDLDDPRGFEPGPEFRQAVVRRVTHRRRRRLRLRAAMVSVVVLMVGIGGTLAFFAHRIDDIARVNVRAALSPTQSPKTPDAPFTLLFVGTDGGRLGVPGSRTDTMMLIRVDPGRRLLTTLSLPRDLYVPIAGTGQSDRLNSAFAGGPSRLIMTIREQLGVEVQHYVQVDFRGAVRIVDAIGGIRLRFTSAARDLQSGFHVDGPGCQQLDGQSALGFGRSRHLQVLVDGQWREDPRADLGRMARAQIAGDALIDAVRRLSASDPIAITRTVNALADDATVDSGLSNGDLIRLARQLRNATSQHLSLPVRSTFVGGPGAGKSVLELQAGSKAVLRAFEAGQTTATTPQLPSMPANPAGMTDPQPCD